MDIKIIRHEIEENSKESYHLYKTWFHCIIAAHRPLQFRSVTYQKQHGETTYLFFQ